MYQIYMTFKSFIQKAVMLMVCGTHTNVLVEQLVGQGYGRLWMLRRSCGGNGMGSLMCKESRLSECCV